MADPIIITVIIDQIFWKGCDFRNGHPFCFCVGIVMFPKVNRENGQRSGIVIFNNTRLEAPSRVPLPGAPPFYLVYLQSQGGTHRKKHRNFRSDDDFLHEHLVF